MDRVHGCYECYKEYVALNGTVVEIDQKKQNSQMQTSLVVFVVYGQARRLSQNEGQGGVGPMLAGQSTDDIINKLTIYKNRGRLEHSLFMWGQAGMLTEQDIETIGKFVQGGMPK